MANRNVQYGPLPDDLAERFDGGRTLIVSDVAEVVPGYGYSEGSAGEVMANINTVIELGRRGIDLAVDRYKNVKIFWNGRLPVEETDIEETRKRIDELRDQSTAKMKQTKGIS